MAESTAPGLLVAMIDIDGEYEGEFNRWYDGEHIPELLAIPGFRAARRYHAVESGPAYQAIYDLESAAVTESAAFKRVIEQPSATTARLRPRFRNLHRGVYSQIYPAPADTPPAPEKVGGALLVGLQIAEEHDDEFNDWYNTEHVPYLSAVPGVLRARRFAPVDGSRQYFALYELASPDVPLSEAWSKASNTPWSARLRRWYTRWLRVRSKAL